MGTGACICVHDDTTYLAATIRALAGTPVHVCVSRVNWKGEEGDWRLAERISLEEGASVMLGDFACEESHREAAYDWMRSLGYGYCLTIDSDEIVEPDLLDALLRIAEANLADRVYVEWDTYWKSPEFVIRPRERFTPCVLINLQSTTYIRVREFAGGRELLLNATHGIIHHFSYSGPDERIFPKVTTWSHRDEVIDGWWDQVWLAWDSNCMLRNLHPTHPSAYDRAEPADQSGWLRALGIQPTDRGDDFHLPSGDKVSIIIPAYGQQGLLDACLASLRSIAGFSPEIIVIDDASPDTILVPEGVLLRRLEANGGFSVACNTGADMASGDVLIFLNSDTVVTRPGLSGLLSSLSSSGVVGAAGPYTNEAGHLQRVPACYSSPSQIEAFAQQFFRDGRPDLDTDMLVGFCLAVKRDAFQEVGGFDERFGRGLFEDNDLCYKLRRSGYRLVIAGRAYIHHEGSKTLTSLNDDLNTSGFSIHAQLIENQRKFCEKWAQDLATGFASHLSGFGVERIVFSPALDPSLLEGKLRELRDRAKISLCMIVRNEERVIADCLQSAKPFFREILVLDTGSSDRTPEIAENNGAVVKLGSWPESFAEARTESMQEASGDWVMWIDADDTIPPQTGYAILDAVINATADTVGFVVPVKFREEGGHGTMVDHVKVFRNFANLRWEGRIHEQILPSLRAEALRRGHPNGGRLIRLDAHVFHSGYDTSETGQAQKRERDKRLLELDLQDRPDHPFVLFNLGMTSHYTGEYETAMHWLERCLEVSDVAESHTRKAYALACANKKVLGLAAESLDIAIAGLERYPSDPELNFYKAQLLAEQELHAEAIEAYRAVLAADISNVFSSLDPGILGYKTRHNLALSLQAVSRPDLAVEEWLQGYAESRKSELAIQAYTVAIESGLHAVASRVMRAVVHTEGLAKTWANLVVTGCSALDLDAAPLLEAPAQEVNSDAELLVALAEYLMRTDRVQQARPVLEHLDRINRPEGAFLLGMLAKDSGDTTSARRLFQRAAELNPSHEPTLVQLGETK